VKYSPLEVNKKTAITVMQTISSVLLWSLVISGITGLIALSGFFASWLLIQLLVVLTGVAA